MSDFDNQVEDVGASEKRAQINAEVKRLHNQYNQLYDVLNAIYKNNEECVRKLIEICNELESQRQNFINATQKSNIGSVDCLQAIEGLINKIKDVEGY